MRCFDCRLPPQISFKMTKICSKIPPILVDKILKAVFSVYRNPRVRTELAETFTIARTFDSLKNFQRKPASISLGARNRGISKKRSFLEIPRFLAPRGIEAGFLLKKLRE